MWQLGSLCLVPIENPTEFDVQGLELDWAGVCWDTNFRREGDNWGAYTRETIQGRNGPYSAYAGNRLKNNCPTVIFVPHIVKLAVR